MSMKPTLPNGMDRLSRLHPMDELALEDKWCREQAVHEHRVCFDPEHPPRPPSPAEEAMADEHGNPVDMMDDTPALESARGLLDQSLEPAFPEDGEVFR